MGQTIKIITLLTFLMVSAYGYDDSVSGNTVTRTYYTSDGIDANFSGGDMSGIISTENELTAHSPLEGLQAINLGVSAGADNIINQEGEYQAQAVISFRCENIPAGAIITDIKLQLTHDTIAVRPNSTFRVYISKRTWGNGKLGVPSVQYSNPFAGLEWSVYNCIWTTPLVVHPVDYYNPMRVYTKIIPSYSTRSSSYVTNQVDVDAVFGSTGLVPTVGGSTFDLTFLLKASSNNSRATFTNSDVQTFYYKGSRIKLVVVYNLGSAPTPTITNTPPGGNTPTFTATPLPPTSTPLNTSTNTNTPVPTVTKTNTATVTNTGTITNTNTPNPLIPTFTITRTFTGTPPTPTRTITQTFTRKFTGTATSSLTPTLTRTVSNTPTRTLTPTLTLSPTFTSSPTPIITPTVSNTLKLTATKTATPTKTITQTPAGATKTPTITNTPTRTFTITQTFTPSPTDANPATPTPTLAELLVAGGNGFPVSSNQGYIETLVVKDLRYDTLTQNTLPASGQMLQESIYLPNQIALSSAGLELGNKSTVQEDFLAIGDSFTVDSAAGDIMTRGSLYITGTPNSANFIKGVSITQDLSHSTNGYGYGVYVEPRGTLGNLLQGLKTNDHNFTGTLDSHGVAANVSKGTSSNIGFAASVGGTGSSINIGAKLVAKGVTTGTNYGIFADATGGATNWAGHFDGGNVYIKNDITMGENPVINFPNSDALRYTDSTAVLDFYNGSDSVFSVDADQGNTTINGGRLSVSGTMGAGNTLTPMRITASMANASDNKGYSTYISPSGTLPLTYYHIYSSDSGGTTGAGVSQSLGIYSFVSKGANDNKAIKGVSGGGGSSYNAGGEFIANGASTSPNTAVLGLATNGKGTHFGGHFSATNGSGTSTTNYGVYATATGGSVANHAGYFDGNVTMTDGDILTTETLSPVDTTGIVLNGATNKITIANDGNMTFAGTATYWDDVVVSGVDVKLAGSSDPTLKAFPTGAATKMYAFPDGTDKEVFTSLQLPHRYKEGSDIGLHVHWSPDANTANDVVWGCDYTWANVIATPSAFAAPTNTTVTSDGGSLQWGHQIAGFPTITGTGKTISSCIVIRIYRDADNVADTHTGDAFLISIDAHFEADSLGSNTTIGK